VVKEMNRHSEKIQRNSEISLSDGRTPEREAREALLTAIQLRDATAAQTASLVEARGRAAQDRFKAARDVEAWEQALANARERSARSLVDAYMSGEDIDTRDVADAESELAKAQRRLADLQTIADGLAAHERQPGSSVPAMNVTAAVRAVVKAAPVTRRLVEDYHIAEPTFHTHHATLVHLAGRGMIPDDLAHAAPSASATRFAEPADEWVQANAALAQDADAPLPE
jgi:hypothetical protein